MDAKLLSLTALWSVYGCILATVGLWPALAAGAVGPACSCWALRF